MSNGTELDASGPDEVMAIVERLARRYAGKGFDHPRVAATVVTLRGLDGVDQGTWAERLGVAAADLADAEHGDTAATDLDEAIVRHAAIVGLPI